MPGARIRSSPVAPGPASAPDSGIDHPALHAGQRRADGVRPVWAIIRRDMGSAGDLGQPVCLLDAAADPLRACTRQVGAQRCRAGGQHAQARHVVAVYQVTGCEAEHHRGHELGPGSPVDLNGAEEGREIEARQDDHGGTLEQCQVHGDLQAEDVKQREGGDHHVVRGDLVHEPRLAQARDQVPVREHDDLRQSGRAARAEQERCVRYGPGRSRRCRSRRG